MQAGLSRYLLTRIARAVWTVIGVVTLVFLLVRLIPGDPVNAILGDQASPEDRAALRTLLGLDQPFAKQYLEFWASVVNGTLGESFAHADTKVMALIAEAFPTTLGLALVSVAIAWLIAVPLGTLAAAWHGSFVDRIASFVALLGLAVPTIWLGPLLILLFAVRLRWLPFPGEQAPAFAHWILPSVSVGSLLAAVLMRQTRAAMLEVSQEPYLVAARARGLSNTTVWIRHALRNSLLPVLTVGGAQFGAVLSGTVVAEKIFERPGLGTLFLDAFFARDIPVIQGCVLVMAMCYVGVNFITDVLYACVDPRVRLR